MTHFNISLETKACCQLSLAKNYIYAKTKDARTANSNNDSCVNKNHSVGVMCKQKSQWKCVNEKKESVVTKFAEHEHRFPLFSNTDCRVDLYLVMSNLSNSTAYIHKKNMPTNIPAAHAFVQIEMRRSKTLNTNTKIT